MKTTWTLAFLFSLLTSGTLAAADNKLLIAGDSWSTFLCVQNSFTRVFEKYKDPRAFNHPGCHLTSRIGMRAEKWLGSSQHRRTLDIISNDKRVKALFLSLGGNDLMNSINKNQSTFEQGLIFESVLQSVSRAVRIYQTARPDLKIVVSGYDYPRFTHNHPISAYRQAFDEMGQPTPGELNRTLLLFSHHMSALTNHLNVFYVHHLGVMHYFDGNSDEGLPAGYTLHPDLISHPLNPLAHGGWIDSAASRRSMLRLTNKLVDAFHLSEHGYYRLAEHTYRLYLKNWLQGP